MTHQEYLNNLKCDPPLQHSKTDKIVVGVLLPRNVRDSSDVVAKEAVNTVFRIIKDY